MDLLSGLTATTLTNKRNSDSDVYPQIFARTTTGALSLSSAAAKDLKIRDGERIVTAELPLSLANGQVEVSGTVPTNPEGDNVIIMYKGQGSNSDRLADEYKNTHPSVGETSEEKKQYNADLSTWVEEQLSERGLEDDPHYGNRVRIQGGSYNFSSKGPWTYLLGNVNGTRVFNVTKYFGIVVYTDLSAELVGEEFEPAKEVQGYVFLNGSTNPNSQWGQGTDLETAVPFFVLEFHEETKKTRGTSDEGGEQEEEGPSVVAEDFVG